MNNSEEWKVYQFGESFDETYQLYFSKYGEVKSFTKNNKNYSTINEQYIHSVFIFDS